VDNCGAAGSYQRGGEPVILVNSPDLVRSVFLRDGSDFTKGPTQATVFRNVFGQSLSMLEGGDWLRRRRELGPLFSRRTVTAHASNVLRITSEACARWPNDAEVSLFDLLSDLTVTVVGRNIIDIPEWWCSGHSFWSARELVWAWMADHTGKGRSLTTPSDEGAEPADEWIRYLQHSVDSVIFERVRGAETRPDILQAMVQRLPGLTNIQLRDQALALLFAAHETNATAIFWSLYLLSRSPEFLRLAVAEARSLVDGPSVEVTDRQLTSSLAQRVLQESMRLYPPAGRQFRVTIHDLRMGGYFVPRDSAVTVCHYYLHRSPAVFSRADIFDPVRFEAMPNYADTSGGYIPFGYGKRRCLGRHYALMEATCILLYLVSKFEFEFEPEISPVLRMTLRPQPGARSQIRRR
jgi:cytochrome P450